MVSLHFLLHLPKGNFSASLALVSAARQSLTAWLLGIPPCLTHRPLEKNLQNGGGWRENGWESGGCDWLAQAYLQEYALLWFLSIKKGTRTPVFIAAIFTVARTQKQLSCPSTEKRIRKMWHTYTMEYYSTRERMVLGYV